MAEEVTWVGPMDISRLVRAEGVIPSCSSRSPCWWNSCGMEGVVGVNFYQGAVANASLLISIMVQTETPHQSYPGDLGSPRRNPALSGR